jgi:hypothetical protein
MRPGIDVALSRRVVVDWLAHFVRPHHLLPHLLVVDGLKDSKAYLIMEMRYSASAGEKSRLRAMLEMKSKGAHKPHLYVHSTAVAPATRQRAAKRPEILQRGEG